MWNECQYHKLMELMKVLGAVCLAIEALGQQNDNLLTSECIFEFLLNELKTLKTEIS